MAMNEFPERFLLGVTQPHLDYEKKDRVERNVATHYCITACSGECAQVKEGMNLLGLMDILANHQVNIQDFLQVFQGSGMRII